MPDQTIYAYLTDGFADWEPAFVLAELRKNGGFRIAPVTLDGQPVTSMGGLLIQPVGSLTSVNPKDAALFLVPGAECWMKGEVPDPLAELLKQLDAAGIPLAFICAATILPHKLGILRKRKHTSNSVEFLARLVPGYPDAAHYVDEPAVRDEKLITASGLANVEFAAEIFAELNYQTPEFREGWSEVFRTGEVPPGFFK